MIRHHAKLTLASVGDWGAAVATATGGVAERTAWVKRDDQEMIQVRCIRVRLKQRTRDGETEIVILSNLPEAVTAETIALLYRRRWTVETMFQELTQYLGCEVNTLGYPKAALFGFCVALVAYNVLAVVKAAMRSVHGEAKVEAEVSGYYLALEISRMTAGMMVAIPEEFWEVFQRFSRKAMVSLLRRLATKMSLARYRKHARRPKRPASERTYEKDQPHIATSELLEERQRQKLKL